MGRQVRRAWRPAAAGAAGLTVLALAASGCELLGGNPGGQATGPGNAAPPVQHQMLEGVPVPVGFKFVPARSTIQIIGTTRVGRCEFEGATAPDATARFYLEQMPAAQFTLRQKRFDAGEYGLRFASPDEECTVRIKPVKSKTFIIIDIGPLAKGDPGAEPPPPAARPSPKPTPQS